MLLHGKEYKVHKVYYTNDQISDLLKEIVRQVANSEWKPDCIIGLSRGGLDIGAKLSHYFSVPFEPLKWQTRNGKFQDKDNLIRIVLGANYKNILIIDDILDSGISLTGIFEELEINVNARNKNTDYESSGPDIRYAALIQNISAKHAIELDYCATEINKDESDSWICFPWENWWAPSLR